MILFLFAAAPPPTPPALILELRRFHAAPTAALPPSLAAAAEALRDERSEKRRRAAALLLAAAKQALADERSGKIWRNGGAREDREALPSPLLLRVCIAGVLSDVGPVEEAAPLAEWSIAEEPSSIAQAGFQHVREDSERGRALALAVVQRRHPDADLLAAALEALRGCPVPRPLLEALAHHHRARVRDAVRELAKEPLPEFDPAKAMASTPIRELLRRIGDELLDRRSATGWSDFECLA